jgi:hypothetical protein
MKFKVFIGIMVIVFWNCSTVAAQAEPDKWAIVAGYETNYMGNNGIIHGRYTIKNHVLELGVNYNFSDGFSANPVIGIGAAYGYQLANTERWNVTTGIDYRRQKPLKIVNIQTIMYTNSVAYKIKPKLWAVTRLGYGLAAERAASAGSFSQNNSLAGNLTIGCVVGL